ncbi:MAG: hypothetical protein AAB554_03040 [Patescibacteria group bacterium]
MENIKFRICINSGHSRTVSGMIMALSGSAPAGSDDPWIVVERVAYGRYVVVDENLTCKGGDWISDATALGFTAWDDEVEDLDAGNSDESQCFGMSAHLRWNDVNLTPDEFRAPSIERLLEALSHVTLCAWCPGDI